MTSSGLAESFPPLPLKSSQIGFLVQKDAQCSETYGKSILRFLFVEKFPILYSKHLENLPNHHHRCPIFFCPKRRAMF